MRRVGVVALVLSVAACHEGVLGGDPTSGCLWTDGGAAPLVIEHDTWEDFFDVMAELLAPSAA